IAKAIAPSDVAAALPQRSVLVDFLVHRSYERTNGTAAGADTWGAPRLSAWISKPGAKRAEWLDLGPSAPIEQLVKSFLEEMRPRGGVGVASNAASAGPSANDRLREALWAPIAKRIADAERVFVCPDGFLATLPFETIQGEDGAYLVEKRS